MPEHEEFQIVFVPKVHGVGEQLTEAPDEQIEFTGGAVTEKVLERAR
jgi:hypothetical protein